MRILTSAYLDVLEILYLCILMRHSRWIHFSRLPFLPEIDALKEDLSIINDIYQHLQMSQDDIEKSYVEAYKYAFSRKGKLISLILTK